MTSNIRIGFLFVKESDGHRDVVFETTVDVESKFIVKTVIDVAKGNAERAGLRCVSQVHAPYRVMVTSDELLEWEGVLQDKLGIKRLSGWPGCPKDIGGRCDYCDETGRKDACKDLY